MITQYADALIAASFTPDKVGWIGWIVIGGLAGWIASKFMGTDKQMGFLLNVVVGIIGGVAGGFILTKLGIDVKGGGYWFTFFTAVAGACILLFIVKLVTGRKG